MTHDGQHGDRGQRPVGRDHRSDGLRRIAAAVADSGSDAPLALRLCRTFIALTGADGCAITLAYTNAARVTLCCTDDRAERLENLQDVLGEGPAPDAFTTGTAEASGGSTAQARRWPMFEEAAREQLGPVGVRAFPLRSAGSVLGVLTEHRSVDATPLIEVGEAQVLADTIAAAIVHGPSDDTLDAGHWTERDRVNQAIGMVVAQLAVGPDDALALLRAFAFSNDLALDEAARMITERQHDFTRSDDFGEDPS